ncbi:zinc finger protein 541 isoform X8 [Heterocephalus glaber]|uniref:Zinc finger protein 541 n=1 Tax=Heterocephalus glaber TaxID=10181 RepID=A0AAX6RXK0_HETGA|nr:zinc finger protein 541 isoform X8 [Heterocephalus glaber]
MQTKQPEQCSSNHKHYFGERETVPQRSLLLETDQGPGALKVPREAEEGGRATLGSARKGKRQHSSPQKALLDCSLCGKVFSSASSLSKHYLTHSQERKHICKICSKAFKRQDHLTGHMLTHQKTKPFVCIEQGCGKSYCDYRSLRRHCEVQHGLCILKEAPPEEDAFGDSPHAPNTAGQPLPSGLQSLGAPEARSPGSVLPNRDLLRCIVSSLVHQKIPSPGPATVGVPSGEGRNASCPCTASPGLSSRIPGSLGTEVPKEPRPLQKEPAADVFTALDSGTAENSDPNPPESEAPLLQLPSSQEDWPEGGSLATSLPPFQVQKVPASSQPSSHGFQWLQSLPSCPKSKGNNVFMVHKAPREGSESGPGASSTSPPAEPSPSAGSSQDTLPLRPTLLKLFLKSQESLASHEQVQVFQMITKSQCIFSHAQVKQLRSSKGTLDLGNIFPSVGPRRSQAAGDELPSAQLSENGPALGATRSEKGPACTQGEGYRLFSGHPRAQRFSGFRKEKVKMDVRCAASPSQVAMASFSSTGPPADPAQDVKSKLTIFNRIQMGSHPVIQICLEPMAVLLPQPSQVLGSQGGNIYRLPHPMKEESMAGRCNQQNRSPTDWTEPRSMFVCKNCSQMFYTEKGLSSHMCFHSDQWPSPRGNQEQQGQEKDGEERNDKDGSQHRKRKKRPQPRALFIPPPPSAFGDPGPGGGHQSCLRSPPVFLVDHLLKGLFQCSPYTPPPMLSPIREGSGIYFNTLCSKSQAGPHQLISSTLDQVDGSFSICVVKDDSKISIEPHINIGSRFQAEIPELQERSLARADEHVASMVWKPWGDVMTNPETQDRVTELCNVACSSVMPGGGTNLELALHCLHEAQGSIQVALETLLIRGARKPWTHPLADYRYTGSDIWTPMEKRLFKKAFCAHKKDFYLIHKMIKTKTVAQCVEYYYVWKKMIKFDCGRAPGLEKRVKRELDGVEMTEEKVTCSPQERRNHSPTPELKIKTKSYRRESILNSSPSAGPKRTPEPPGSVESQGVFPCRECDRVFDKIKSRNAHMKRHRLQEHAEPILRVKWPAKPFLLKEEEEEEELGTDISPLQW